MTPSSSEATPDQESVREESKLTEKSSQLTPADSISCTTYKTHATSCITTASTKQKLAQLEKDFEMERSRRMKAEAQI